MAGLLLTYIWRFHDLTSGLSALRLAAICTVGSWVYLVLKPRWRVLGRAVRLPYVSLFLVFSAWGLITAFFALSPEVAFLDWREAHFKTITMVLFLISALTTFALIRLAIVVQTTGAAVLAYFYIKGGFAQWGSPVPMYDRNDMALLFNVALPLILFLVFTAKTRNGRVLVGLVALAVATSVLMSQSRSGFLTFGVTVAGTLVIARGIPLKFRLALPVLLGLSLFALPSHIQERLSTILEAEEDYNYTSETGRVEIWKRGLGYINDHKAFGVGWQNFYIAEATISERARLGTGGRGQVAHNSFIQVAAETGVPGFILYVGAIVAAIVSLLRLQARLRRFRGVPLAHEMSLCAAFLIISIIAFCVGGQFLSMSYHPLLFGQFALAAGLQFSAAGWEREQQARRFHGPRNRSQMSLSRTTTPVG